MKFDIFANGRVELVFRVFVGNNLVGYMVTTNAGNNCGFISKTHTDIVCNKYESEIDGAREIPRITAISVGSTLVIEQDSKYFNAAMKYEDIVNEVSVYKGKEAIVLDTRVSKDNATKLVEYINLIIDKIETTKKQKLAKEAEAKRVAQKISDKWTAREKSKRAEEEFEISGMVKKMPSIFGKIIAAVYKDNKPFGIVTEVDYYGCGDVQSGKPDSEKYPDRASMLQYDIVDYIESITAYPKLKLNKVMRYDIVGEIDTELKVSDIGFRAKKLLKEYKEGIKYSIVELKTFKAVSSGIRNIELPAEICLKAQYTSKGESVFGFCKGTSRDGMPNEMVQLLCSVYKENRKGITVAKDAFTVKTPLGHFIGAVYQDGNVVGVIREESILGERTINFSVQAVTAQSLKFLEGFEYRKLSRVCVGAVLDGRAMYQPVALLGAEIIDWYNEKYTENNISSEDILKLERYNYTDGVYLDNKEVKRNGVNHKYKNMVYEVEDKEGNKYYTRLSVDKDANAVFNKDAMTGMGASIKEEISERFSVVK